MTIRLRLLLLACAAATGLAFAGPALAAYQSPRLLVDASSYSRGARATVAFVASINSNDDATAKITIYAPPSYGLTLGQAPGTRIGTVAASIKSSSLGGGIVPLSGFVQVANPADVAAASQACTGTPTHQAVWLLVATVAGQTLQVPLFVDAITSGSESSFAGAKIQICFRSPYIPESQGGQPLGAQLVSALFTVQGVFSNPGANALSVWESFFTPYVPGTANANPAGTVESRALVPVPYSITLRVRNLGRFAILSGKITMAGQPLPRAQVELDVGTKKNNINKVATRNVRTNARGEFRIRRAVTRTPRFYQAWAGPYEYTDQGCDAPKAPGGCVSATISEVGSSIARVSRLPKRRR